MPKTHVAGFRITFRVLVGAQWVIASRDCKGMGYAPLVAIAVEWAGWVWVMSGVGHEKPAPSICVHFVTSVFGTVPFHQFAIPQPRRILGIPLGLPK